MPVFAQDAGELSLEELLTTKVVSASKYEQKVNEAPSSITVISAEQIRHYGYRTLRDALETVPGFYVRNHGSYSTIGVRGFAPSGDSTGRILVLINGHAINNNIDDSVPMENDFPVDLDLVNRIEVVRGPSSSLYGADAFFAVVNVITQTGKDTGVMVSGEAGSLGTYKETATYGLNKSHTQALFSTTYWDTNAPGRLDSIQNPEGRKSERDQSRRAFAMISSHDFTLQAAASAYQEKGSSSAQWCGSCHQTESNGTSFRGYVDLQYEHKVWKGAQLTARTYYDTYASHGKYNDLRTCSNTHCHGTLFDYDTAHGDRVGAEVKLTKRFLDKHRFTIGTEYRDNLRQAQSNYIIYNQPATTQSYVNYNRTSGIWGIYGEAELRLHPKLIFNAGFRTDKYNNFIGSATSPRAALIYTPQKSTTLKFLYGTAFRAPSYAELYYAGMASVPSPDLKPEKIRTFEGVLSQQMGKHVTINASAFYNNIGRYIESQTTVVQGPHGPIDGTGFFNAKAVAKGAELEVVGKMLSGTEGRLSYTYQDAKNVLGGGQLPDAPKHVAKADLAYPLFHHALTPAVQAEYISRSYVMWPGTGYSAPPVVVNASLSTRQFWRGFSLTGSAYNLVGRSLSNNTIGYFEQTHVVPSKSLLPDDRRTFRIKLTWTSGEGDGKHAPKTDSAEAH